MNANSVASSARRPAVVAAQFEVAACGALDDVDFAGASDAECGTDAKVVRGDEVRSAVGGDRGGVTDDRGRVERKSRAHGCGCEVRSAGERRLSGTGRMRERDGGKARVDAQVTRRIDGDFTEPLRPADKPAENDVMTKGIESQIFECRGSLRRAPR